MRHPFTNLTKNRAVLGASVAALALAGSGLAYATSGTEVTVSIDGTAQQISARGDTVREVLESQGIEVSDRDVVAPGLDAPVEDGDRIAVRFAREVNLNVDGEKSSYWVTANDVASALDEIGSRFAGAALSVSRGAAIGREGLNLEVATPKKLRVWVAGREVKKVNIAAFDAADLLEEMNVRADGDDEIKILGRGEKKAKWGMAKPLEDGDKVTFTRVREITKRFRAETVDFETIEREDDSMPAGETEVVRAGSTGTRDVTYRLRYENGELVARKVLRARVLSAPVSAIVRVGTQEAAAANFASGSTVWDSLAQCESGGNWAINTGNGYYGGLQFALSTWQSYGGTGYPHEASRETQIMIAERVRDASGGYGAWPACAAKLGLPT